jgi:hypothetical protein
VTGVFSSQEWIPENPLRFFSARCKVRDTAGVFASQEWMPENLLHLFAGTL